MIRQNLLTGNKPYEARFIGRGNGFPNHTHYEIEIIYVFENTAHIYVNDEEHAVGEGEAIVIGSAVTHGYKEAELYRGLLIEMGPVLLRDKFKYITSLPFQSKHFKPENPDDLKVLDLLKEISEECKSAGKTQDLILQSSLYRLFAYVVDNIAEAHGENVGALSEPKSTGKIDPALELIHQRYQEPLTVEDAAAACGYGKSNFSKVFKNALGIGFHQYLINYRLENAKYLLTETKLSIYQISDMVGFSDPKIFCRVFKNNVGTSPAQFRKDLFNKLF